jgi:thioredoxin-related protein
MLYRIILIACFHLLTTNSVKAQLKLVQFDALDSLQKKAPKRVVFFIHTSWCVYCAQMKFTTLKNKQVVDLLNKSFYFISFDAERKDPVYFGGKKFSFLPNGKETGVHELAAELATISGKLSYPSLCILNTKNEIDFQYSGVLSSVELLSILRKPIINK